MIRKPRITVSFNLYELEEIIRLITERGFNGFLYRKISNAYHKLIDKTIDYTLQKDYEDTMRKNYKDTRRKNEERS